MRLAASHLDCPMLRLKLNGFRKSHGVALVPAEIYGGPIVSTWFDRPLGIAGRLIDSRSGDERTVDWKNAAVVPNLAIHLSKNDGAAVNPQQHLNAIVSLGEAPAFPDLDDIGHFKDSELFLYDCSPATLLCGSALVNAPHLDNLSSAYPALQALLSSGQGPCLNVSFFADNEEIGSGTPFGADSSFLPDTLLRIVLASGGTQEDCFMAMSRSFLVSADAAHAVHPSYPDKHDPDYAPVLGGGVALKRNASWRYCTNGPSSAMFRRIAASAGARLQEFTNRADMPCGSTVGPAMAARLGLPGVDVGVPMLAMHSTRETCALSDISDMTDILAAFFSE